METLKAILTPEWYEVLKDEIMKNPEWERYLGGDREDTFPERENTFRAINEIDINKAKVVIFGQDPYPRKESATGYAFWDGKIVDWNNPLSPSLRNLFKSVLVSKGWAKTTDCVADVRRIVTEKQLMQPGAFFKNSIDQGVVWLNASLTFTSKDTKELRRHLKFWKPMIKLIIESLMAKNSDLVFVFWGAKAKVFQKIISNVQSECRFEYVENNHPMMESFHLKNTFNDISNAQIKLGQRPIKWI